MRLLVASFAVLLVSCGSNVSTAVSPREDIAAASGDITDERFEKVKAIFENQGATVERDFTSMGANTVRVYLPAAVAMSITPLQAKTMASVARSRLGENAIVYIKGPGGNTIAKAWDIDP